MLKVNSVPKSSTSIIKELLFAKFPLEAHTTTLESNKLYKRAPSAAVLQTMFRANEITFVICCLLNRPRSGK